MVTPVMDINDWDAASEGGLDLLRVRGLKIHRGNPQQSLWWHDEMKPHLAGGKGSEKPTFLRLP